MHNGRVLLSQVIKYQLLVIVFTALTLTSCRELVQDEFPDFTSVPVVNSFLVADSLIKVHVSLTGKLEAVPLTVVDQATVTCYVNDSVAVDLTPAGDGYYIGNKRVKAGSVYRFRVSIPGYTDMTATDTIPEPVPLISIEHINDGGIDEEGFKFPAVHITFPVDPDHLSYYELTIMVAGYHDRWYKAALEEFSDPVLLAEGLPIAVFSTEKIRDTTYTFKIDYQSGTTSYNIPNTEIMMVKYNPFFVELKAISWQYYQYLKQLYLYNTGRYPEFRFGSYQAFPIFSNVTGGKGIVAGYSVYRSEIINPKPVRK